MVHDVSNGESLETPAALYYAVGRINSDRVQRYERAAANKLLRTTKHFGPWEVSADPDTSDSGSSPPPLKGRGPETSPEPAGEPPA